MNKSIIIIDPVGKLKSSILPKISQKNVKYTKVFDFADKAYTICCNLLTCLGSATSKLADDLTNAFRILFDATAWGHNIEHGLYCCFCALPKGEGLTLEDGITLFSETTETKNLINYLLPRIDNRAVRSFLTTELPRMSKAEKRRIVSRLTKFLAHGFAGKIFSQRINKFNPKEIMNTPGLYIFDVPSGKIGTIETDMICSILFSLFQTTGMERINDPNDQYLQTIILVDEFQRYYHRTSIQDSIRDLRKFNVSLVLGFQQIQELPESTKKAIANVSTKIVLEPSLEDASYLAKQFNIETSDFLGKNIGEGYIKIGRDCMNIQTCNLPVSKDKGFSDDIIRLSREAYYIPATENIVEDTSKEINQPNFKMYDEV